MKKLGKITISTDKVMKNEELINLQGGYDTGCCICINGLAMLAGNYNECMEFCFQLTHYPGNWYC